MTKITYIPGEIANAAIDEHGNRKPVTRTHHIFDDAKDKNQAEVNAEVDDTFALHQSEINALNSQNYVTVDSFSSLPATGAVDTVYRVSNWDGTQQDPSVYSEYAWNGEDYVHLSTKTQIGEVFDISAYHATGGTLATYADLSAALDSNNGGGVPQSLQKGGMSIKFVCSSDNKYVQFRYMSSSTANADFTNIANWQGVDDEPTTGSDNLVKSSGVYNAIRREQIEVNYFSLLNYSINTLTNKFGTSISNKHGSVPVNEGEIFSIVVNAAKIAYCFATSNVFSHGADLPLVDGTTPTFIDGSSVDNIVIPKGCKYLLFYATGGSSDVNDYSIRKNVSKETELIEEKSSEIEFELIRDTYKLQYSYIPAGTAKTVNNKLRNGAEYYIVIHCNSLINKTIVGFGTNSSNISVKLIDNSCLKNGFNIFKATYDGSPCLITSEYSQVDNVYIFNTDTPIAKKLENTICNSIIGRSGGLLKSESLRQLAGDSLAYEPLRVYFEASGQIGLRLNDSNDAFDSCNVIVWKKGDSDFTNIGSSTSIINGWLYINIDYTITCISVLTGTSNVAASNSDISLDVMVFGKLETVEKTVAVHQQALTINDYVEITTEDTEIGKCIHSNGIISNNKFILYTYQIENDKKYYIHAYLNSGWSNNYIVGYSTDKEGLDFLGGEFKGETSNALLVPSADSSLYYQKLNIPEGAHYFHIGIRNTDFATNYLKVAYSEVGTLFNATEFNDRLEAVEEGAHTDNSIDSLYNNHTHLEKIRAVTKGIINGRGNEDTHVSTDYPQPLVLLHFSDIHGNSVNYQRVMDYYNIYANHIDDVIHTGDLVSDYYDNGIDFATDIEGFENVLNVIGNHDTRKRNSEYDDTRQWSEYAGKVAYDTYMVGPDVQHPYISNWSVIQPSDAASVGKCYYYKDYTDKGVRLIVIDNMVMLTTSANYDANQLTWFEGVLDDARQNGLTVIVAMHFPNDNGVIECPFTGYGKAANTSNWAISQIKNYFKAVDEFKNPEREPGETDEEYESRRGKFACYIGGHTHTSLIGHPYKDSSSNYEDQLIICVGSAIMDGRNVWPRALNTKTQDFFHVLALDTVRSRVSVLQVGVEYDAWMRHRECFSYDYKSSTIIKISE